MTMPRMLGASPRHRWAVCACRHCRYGRGNKDWKRDMQKAPQRAWEKRQWRGETDAWRGAQHRVWLLALAAYELAPYDCEEATDPTRPW